jgi:hypothetical protein
MSSLCILSQALYVGKRVRRLVGVSVGSLVRWLTTSQPANEPTNTPSLIY